MSSEATGSDRAYIVDEMTDSHIGDNDRGRYFASTDYEENPWIQIDLRKKFCITAVKIWNRRKASKHTQGI